MRSLRSYWRSGVVFLGLILTGAGCTTTPFDGSEETRGPAPLRAPGPEMEAACCDSYEDRLTGGQIFSMYCGYCHNAPALAERPFSNFQNVAAHMRVRANLTGKEYAKLGVWLRRWHDVPPPGQNEAPGPKRFIFSQPIAELLSGPRSVTPNPPASPPVRCHSDRETESGGRRGN